MKRKQNVLLFRCQLLLPSSILGLRTVMFPYWGPYWFRWLFLLAFGVVAFGFTPVYLMKSRVNHQIFISRKNNAHQDSSRSLCLNMTRHQNIIVQMAVGNAYRIQCIPNNVFLLFARWWGYQFSYPNKQVKNGTDSTNPPSSKSSAPRPFKLPYNIGLN